MGFTNQCGDQKKKHNGFLVWSTTQWLVLVSLSFVLYRLGFMPSPPPIFVDLTQMYITLHPRPWFDGHHLALRKVHALGRDFELEGRAL